MKIHHTARIIPFFVVSMLGLAFTGCIATNSSNTNIAGKMVPDDVFAQVQPGKTKNFVLDLMGNPATKSTLDNGREVWRWNYDETKTAEKTFMIFYVAVDRTHTVQTAAVAFQDGIVVKAWRE
jgi:outer membrane protein assembly factor BamE (lipoprotein component of BamABCDE complex)